MVVALMDVHYRRLDGGELNLPCCNVFGVRDGVVNDYRIYMDVNPVLEPYQSTDLQGYRRQRRIEIQARLNVFQRRGEGSDKFVGQRLEEQFLDQHRVTRRRVDHGVQAFLGQHRISRPAVFGGLQALGEAALAQPPQVVGEPAAFPADQGSKIGDLHLVFRRTAQRVEYVIVGQRKIAVTLQLAVDLVAHPQLDSHEGNPRAEL